MIFRWTLWGMHKVESVELLKYSIMSFKHHFGDAHEYVIGTDNVESLKEKIGEIARIIDFNEDGPSIYDIQTKATWKKWCPRVKIDNSKTEIYVDSDVFLLKYPKEFDDIINNPKIKFAIMDEFFGQPWQHGAMQRKATKDTPFVNAGLFIQKAGVTIENELLSELKWWSENIPKEEQTHHDEQGALAIALTPYFLKGELAILPKDRYMLIGPNENKDIENLNNVTMFHAVYPEHPAFYKFKQNLDDMFNRK
jgi:hypothetical protein